jgi:hypothetical protein
MALVESRRAIILTDSSLFYRPAIGRPVQVEFAQIVSVEKCTVPVPSLAILRPRLSKGLRFKLTNGEQIAIPIDLPNSRDISHRFLMTS